MNRDIELIERVRRLWLDSSERRKKRRRLKDFTYGRQWGDVICLPGGEVTTEGDALQSEGRTPITNNLIRQLVKNVTGRWLMGRPEARASDARALEEFLISGTVVQRLRMEGETWGREISDISPDRLFSEIFRESDASDCLLIGVLHDMGEAELCSRFGATPDVRKVFRFSPRHRGLSRGGTSDFETPDTGGTVRVAEVWELIVGDNGAPRWRQSWLGMQGELLGRSSYGAEHRLPLVVRFYPMIDGEVHSLVEDVVSQQKVVNRMVSLLDEVLSMTAKGMVIYPVDQLPDGITWEELREMWGTPGGILPFRRTSKTIMPREVTGTGNVSGASELLKVQLEMFRDVSGVAASVGHDDRRRSAEALREQENLAGIGLRGMLADFDAFLSDRDSRLRRAPGRNRQQKKPTETNDKS